MYLPNYDITIPSDAKGIENVFYQYAEKNPFGDWINDDLYESEEAQYNGDNPIGTISVAWQTREYTNDMSSGLQPSYIEHCTEITELEIILDKMEHKNG